MTIYLFNTSIIPPNFEGVVEVKEISPDEAREVLKDGFESSVGHEGTAKALEAILGITVPVQRFNTEVFAGDKVVAFQLLERLPEGVVLSAEELKKFPYQLRLLEFVYSVV